MFKLMKKLIKDWSHQESNPDAFSNQLQRQTTILVDLHHVVNAITNPIVKDHLLDQLPQLFEFLGQKHGSPLVHIRAYGCLRAIGLMACEYQTDHALVQLIDTPAVNARGKCLTEAELLVDLLSSATHSKKMVLMSQDVAFTPAIKAIKDTVLEVIGFEQSKTWPDVHIQNGFDVLVDSGVLDLSLAQSILAHEFSHVSSISIAQLSYDLSSFSGNEWMGAGTFERFMTTHFKVMFDGTHILRINPRDLGGNRFSSEIFKELKNTYVADTNSIAKTLKKLLVEKYKFLYSDRDLMALAIKLTPLMKKQATNRIACDYIDWLISRSCLS